MHLARLHSREAAGYQLLQPVSVQREEGQTGKEGRRQSSERIALTLFGRLIHCQECTPSSGHVGRRGPTNANC